MKWYENRILSAQSGTNPMVIKELAGGYVVFGDVQFLPGYCVLLPKKEVTSLNDLPMNERKQFLMDMTFVGDAIIAVCQPLRLNYDILGNSANFLHAHIFPRYEWEIDERKKMPVWLYDSANWHDPATRYKPAKHDDIRFSIKKFLDDNYPI